MSHAFAAQSELSAPVRARRRTKRDALLELLRDGLWHPTLECTEHGGLRFGARLLELRQDGFDIETRGEDNQCAYRLVSSERHELLLPRELRGQLAPREWESIAAGMPSLVARREAERVLKGRP